MCLCVSSFQVVSSSEGDTAGTKITVKDMILLSVGLANTTKKSHYFICEVTVSDLTLEVSESDITQKCFPPVNE